MVFDIALGMTGRGLAAAAMRTSAVVLLIGDGEGGEHRW